VDDARERGLEEGGEVVGSGGGKGCEEVGSGDGTACDKGERREEPGVGGVCFEGVAGMVGARQMALKRSKGMLQCT
jgi:hypothetical protein